MAAMECDWVDVIGHASGLIMLFGMFRKTMIPVRLSLVIGNVGFIAFGLLAGSEPTWITHLALLPLNAYRLHQVWALIRTIRHSSGGELRLDMLLPYMSLTKVSEGTVLFRKGDTPDRMIIIKSGTVRVQELGIVCGPHEVLGELAAFTPDGKRTGTAVAAEDCELYTLSNESMLQIYYQNPEFGMFLIRTVVGRLMANWEDAEKRVLVT